VLRKISAVIFISALIFSFAGCESKPQQKDQIVMWLVGSEAQSHIINELGREFTAETGIEVICQAISWGDAHSKYLTSIAGEVTPDIGTMGLTWGMEFGELGALVDLREAFPEDVSKLETKIFPSMLESTQVSRKVFGIPFDLSVQVMYYRKDLVPVPPKTWNELLQKIRDLKAQNKGMVYDWGSLEWIGYSAFLWQAGGEYYNPDYTKVTLDTPQAAEAMQFFADLYTVGMPKTQVPLEQGMRTGDYPLAISGNWKIISLTVGAPELKGKWGIALLPEGPTGKRTAFIGGRILSVFSRSKLKKESWEFIKFLYRPESQVRIYEASLETDDAYLPPNMDTWGALPMDKEFKKVLVNQAKDAKGPPPVLAWDSSTRFVNHAIQMVVLRGADPSEELEKATVHMQKELDARRR
jgi:ABC-type glycerol-3-phosphate transport system substrate-binding protein